MRSMFWTWNAWHVLAVYFILFVFDIDERIFQKKEKSEARKGYMTQNITTSQVINEHCSCCHGNYYHSNVANGIWGRAREICENYCQIQLGSFRLNSAVRPPGPSLISYQIERGIGMLELNPDARAITGFWRQLIEEGWPYPTTLISIIADIFLLVVVPSCHLQQGYNCSDNTGVSVQFTPLFGAESVKGREKERSSSAWIAPHHPFSLTWLNEK